MSDTTVLATAITRKGMARMFGHDPGPSMVTSAVLETSAGQRIAMPFVPDVAAATCGRTVLVIGAPSGGCHVTAIGLLAEDGEIIVWASPRSGPIELAAADTITVQVGEGL